MSELVIDCTKMPETVMYQISQQEQRLRTLIWSPEKFKLWQSSKQHTPAKSDGYIIQNELAEKTLPPVHVLEFLQKNPHLIPKKWQGKCGPYAFRIFALGTVFEMNGLGWVKCLTKKHDGSWQLEMWPLSFEMGREDYMLLQEE
jgi:hypothetical protein